jgi:hypothetical protein
MITQNMKRRLRALGYADEAIAQLTPQRAYEILAGRAPPDGAKNNHAPAGDVLVGDDPGDGSSSGGGLGQAWHELRGIYRRGHASDDTDKAVAIARAAYAKAIGEGAQPEQIIEAAKQWIAAADAPRSLPSLATWLETRSFEKPPPEKKPRKQQAWSGPPRGYRPRKPDLAAMMRALGEEG